VYNRSMNCMLVVLVCFKALSASNVLVDVNRVCKLTSFSKTRQLSTADSDYVIDHVCTSAASRLRLSLCVSCH